MRSYSDITLKYLKKNKKRTLFTIIGIILSLSLISGVGFLGLSFNDFMYERTIKNNGDYEFLVRDLNKEQINILKNDVDLEKVAVDSQSSMYIYGDKNEESEVRIDILEEDEVSFKEVFQEGLKEGRYPENNTEVVLGSSAKEDLNIKIGDTLKLNSVTYSEAGEEYLTGEIKEYKVVGFKEDKIISDGTYFYGYTLLEELKENENYSTFFTVINNKNKVDIVIEKLEELLNKDIDEYRLSEEGIFVNNDLLALRGESNYRGVNTAIKYIVIFILAIIIFATIFLIYNAINISVTERMNHFGIIRSIGATPNKIRNIVLKEGLIMCLLAVPFGIIFGFLGVMITVKLLQSEITTLIGDGIFNVRFYPSIIIFTAILGIITILLASFAPAKKAGKVSPISIIKGNNNGEKIKYYNGKLIRKIFGVEGWIAYKNIRKNSKRFMVTILSLSISLIMFITFTTLNMKRIDELNYLNESTLEQGSIHVYEEEFRDEVEEKLKAIDGIDRIYSRFETSFPLVLEPNIIADEFKDMYNLRYSQYQNEQVRISTFNDEVLKYIGIEDGLKGNEIILVNNIVMFSNTGKVERINVTNLKEGDTIKIPKASIDYITNRQVLNEDIKNSIDKDIENSNYYEFKVKKVIDKNPFTQGYNYSFEVVVSEDFMKPFREQEFIGTTNLGFRYPDINNIEQTKEIAKEVKELAEQYYSWFDDSSEYNRSTEQMWTVVNVFVYGFIIMISLIGIVNVINTISLNILLKKKEFGTLGTIGMNRGQLTKMVLLEGLLHGIISSIIGGVLSVGLVLVAVRIMGFGFSFGNKLYWQPFAIGFIINLLVVFIASLIPLNKLKKMSLVETIRNVE